MSHYTQEEARWYDRRAKTQVRYLHWEEDYTDYLHTPYKKYLSYFRQFQGRPAKILELCCGMGQFTFDIARLSGGEVLAVDVSPGAIVIAQQECKNHPDLRIQFQVADVMHLQLEPSSFDVVCMSGSLSCVDVPQVMQCVHRYLKPNGAFIAIDTYGYNPFLNLKRILNYYILKKTTKKTLHSIPKKETLSLIASGFEMVTIDFYGIFAFVGALVRPFMGKRYTTRLVDVLDKPFPFLKKYAFKFVLFAHNKKQHGG